MHIVQEQLIRHARVQVRRKTIRWTLAKRNWLDSVERLLHKYASGRHKEV